LCCPKGLITGKPFKMGADLQPPHATGKEINTTRSTASSLSVNSLEKSANQSVVDPQLEKNDIMNLGKGPETEEAQAVPAESDSNTPSSEENVEYPKVWQI
jgi:hypothetical protein